MPWFRRTGEPDDDVVVVVVGGTGDVVVVEPVIELKPVKPYVVEKDIPAQLDAND